MKNYKDNCTKGKAKINKALSFTSWVSIEVNNKTWVAEAKNVNNEVGEKSMHANAQLILEAFNTLTKTGYTPNQLAEQNKELLEALKIAYEQIKISEKQIPIQNGFNLATEQGKKGWEIFSNKMVKIEKAIANAEK